MLMDNFEIANEFLTAADKRKQITILAELNACKEDAIVEILEKDARVKPKMLSAWKIARARRETVKKKREEKAEAMKAEAAAKQAEAMAQETEEAQEQEETEQPARVRTPIISWGGCGPAGERICKDARHGARRTGAAVQGCKRAAEDGRTGDRRCMTYC